MQCMLGNIPAVLRARKLREDESGLLFPIMSKNDRRATHPWYQLQLPRLPS